MKLFLKQRVQFITSRLALVSLLALFGVGLNYQHCLNASPTNTISIPNSFTPNTTIQSSQVNANNNEIQTKFNAHNHTDITQVSTITTGTWASTVIGTQYGGTGQDFSAATQGGMIYLSGTGTFSKLVASNSGLALITYGNNTNPSWGYPTVVYNSLPSGLAVQVVNSQTGALASGTTVMPFDDTIPQNTEGDQYLSLAITPKSTTDVLKIDVSLYIGCPDGSAIVSMGLFQDTTANALAATSMLETSGYPLPVHFTYYMTAGTTSATTFKVRAGKSGGVNTVYLNGYNGGGKFGGAAVSSITITEFKA